jgi:hypothetical protein
LDSPQEQPCVGFRYPLVTNFEDGLYRCKIWREQADIARKVPARVIDTASQNPLSPECCREETSGDGLSALPSFGVLSYELGDELTQFIGSRQSTGGFIRGCSPTIAPPNRDVGRQGAQRVVLRRNAIEFAKQPTQLNNDRASPTVYRNGGRDAFLSEVGLVVQRLWPSRSKVKPQGRRLGNDDICAKPTR